MISKNVPSLFASGVNSKNNKKAAIPVFIEKGNGCFLTIKVLPCDLIWLNSGPLLPNAENQRWLDCL